jgi:hypothetical protein
MEATLEKEKAKGQAGDALPATLVAGVDALIRRTDLTATTVGAFLSALRETHGAEAVDAHRAAIKARLTAAAAAASASPGGGAKRERTADGGGSDAGKRARVGGATATGSGKATAAAATGSSGKAQQNAEGETYVQLASRLKRATVRQFAKKWYVDVRALYEKDGALAPTPKGAMLATADAWPRLCALAPRLTEAMARRETMPAEVLAGARRAEVTEFKGKWYVDLREWYVDKKGDGGGELKRGKKGIMLNPDDWAALVAGLPALNARLELEGEAPLEAGEKAGKQAARRRKPGDYSSSESGDDSDSDDE